MHVNRIYGGALWGGAAAGAIIAFGTCVIAAVVWGIRIDGFDAATFARGIGGGIMIGVLGAFVGALLGFAVGIGTSLTGALVTGVARLLGEPVSGPMMIVAGAVGTVPVMAWLTFWLRDTVYYGPGVGLVLVFGAVAVVAAAAAVCLNWLFSPRRRFGVPEAEDEIEEAPAEPVPAM